MHCFFGEGEEETNSNAVVFFLPLEFPSSQSELAQTLTPTNLLGFSINGGMVVK